MSDSWAERPDDSMASAALSIPATIDRVWLALTTDGGLAPWMGDGASLDPRPGGIVRLPDPVGGVTRRGRVDQVRAPDDEAGASLVFTWWPALRPAESTTVQITLVPDPAGTAIRVVEGPAPVRPTRAFGRPLARGAGLGCSGPSTSSMPAGAGRGSAAGSRGGRRPPSVATSARPGGARSPIGSWAWRLALLTVTVSPCLV